MAGSLKGVYQRIFKSSDSGVGTNRENGFWGAEDDLRARNIDVKHAWRSVKFRKCQRGTGEIAWR